MVALWLVGDPPENKRRMRTGWVLGKKAPSLRKGKEGSVKRSNQKPSETGTSAAKVADIRHFFEAKCGGLTPSLESAESEDKCGGPTKGPLQ